MTLWKSFKEWFNIIMAILRADQRKMDELKEIHRKKELAEMDLSGEWSDSRGKEGASWHVPLHKDIHGNEYDPKTASGNGQYDFSEEPDNDRYDDEVLGI